MPLKEIVGLLGDISRVATSGEKALRVTKRAVRNFQTMTDGERAALGKDSALAALGHAAEILSGPSPAKRRAKVGRAAARAAASSVAEMDFDDAGELDEEPVAE